MGMNKIEENLKEARRLKVRQLFEGYELFGFETRNKYQVINDSGELLAYAAEEKTGVRGIVFRHFFGHWRPFNVWLYDAERAQSYKLHFPFRWFLKTLFVSDSQGRRRGYLQQRFALFRKKFDAYDAQGKIIARINSSLFRFWTFEFIQRGKRVATIQKKWSGSLTELFTDKDNFVISYADPKLSVDEKIIMLSTCFMVDIIYFENHRGS
jgi:hypothetical protein